MRVRILVPILVVAGLLHAVWLTNPTGAQPAPGGSIALGAPPRVTTVGEPARVNLTVSATAGAELHWTVLAAVCNRREYALAFHVPLEPRPITGGPIAVPTDGTALAPIDVVLPTDNQRDPDRCPDSGIFPIEFRLTAPDEGDELDRILVYVTEIDPDATARRPLSVALHLDLSMPVALQPDGTTRLDPNTVDSMQVVTAALVAHPDVPVTLSINPETIVALDNDPAGSQIVTDLNEIVGASAQVLSAPYVRLDETAWWREGLSDVLDLQYTLGDQTLTQIVGATPTSRVIVVDPSTTPVALDELRSRGVTAVVVEPGTLSPLDTEDFPLTLTQRFVLRTARDAPIPAAQIDADAAENFGDGIYEAHRVLTDLEVLGFDQPNVPRGVVIEPPADWRPTRDFLRGLLSGLRDDPVLTPVTIADFFAPSQVGVADARGQIDRPSPLEPLVRRLTPAPIDSTDGYLGAYNLFSDGLDSYATIRGDDGGQEVAELRTRLLVAGSHDLSLDERDEYFTEVNDLVADDIAGISGPEPETITITARRADIPITIVNDLGYEANVVLVLASDKLEFPDGPEIPWTLQPGVNEDIAIPVRARTSGDSLLQVTVRSPDLRLQLGNTGRVTVRSTALSGLGLVMSIAAIAMLAVWWGRQILRSRRERRQSTSLVDAGTGSIEEPL